MNFKWFSRKKESRVIIPACTVVFLKLPNRVMSETSAYTYAIVNNDVTTRETDITITMFSIHKNGICPRLVKSLKSMVVPKECIKQIITFSPEQIEAELGVTYTEILLS